MGVIDDPTVEVDHRDGNGLNNRRRSNLRVCSHSQNGANQKKHKNNTSGFKGVVLYKDNRSRPWCARIKVEGRHIYLGYFATPDEAAKAYDAAAIRLHGEFARTNF
jgi:hypothetical protein